MTGSEGWTVFQVLLALQLYLLKYRFLIKTRERYDILGDNVGFLLFSTMFASASGGVGLAIVTNTPPPRCGF